jgi:hypothetical protein
MDGETKPVEAGPSVTCHQNGRWREESCRGPLRLGQFRLCHHRDGRILPIFLKDYWYGGTAETVSTARLGMANSITGLVIAALAPMLGAIADRGGAKKKFLLFSPPWRRRRRDCISSPGATGASP